MKFLENTIVEFLEPAQEEMDEAFEYYEFEQTNLGYRFINEVKNALQRIISFPDAWQKITINTHRCLVKNFPFGIIYEIRADKILIIAVANLHRKPNYWQNRK